MKIGIMQPYFFPYLGYWQLIKSVDKFILIDDVTFIKQGFINKNYILSKNKPQHINLLINKISSNKLIVHHELNMNVKWKIKLLKTIKQNYSKAEYFDQSFPIVENCIMYSTINLSNYLEYQIKLIIQYLNIKTEIVKSSELKKEGNFKGEERIIKLCKNEDADMYINPIGGRNLYNKDNFFEKGISLKFLKMHDLVYKQFNKNFEPLLSIIDVMMFNDVKKIHKMLDMYDLI